MLPIIQYEDNIKPLSTLNNYPLPLITSHAEGEIKGLQFLRFICFMKRNRQKDNAYSCFDPYGFTPEL